jgi:hypothetical protein
MTILTLIRGGAHGKTDEEVAKDIGVRMLTYSQAMAYIKGCNARRKALYDVNAQRPTMKDMREEAGLPTWMLS